MNLILSVKKLLYYYYSWWVGVSVGGFVPPPPVCQKCIYLEFGFICDSLMSGGGGRVIVV